MSAIRAYSPPIPTTGLRTIGHPEPSPTGIAKVLAGLVEIGIIGVKPEDLAKLIPPDGMEPALVIMADVRAYFQGTVFSFVTILIRLIPVRITVLFSRIQAIRGQCTTRY
jgi:hypothetical protein